MVRFSYWLLAMITTYTTSFSGFLLLFSILLLLLFWTLFWTWSNPPTQSFLLVSTDMTMTTIRNFWVYQWCEVNNDIPCECEFAFTIVTFTLTQIFQLQIEWISLSKRENALFFHHFFFKRFKTISFDYNFFLFSYSLRYSFIFIFFMRIVLILFFNSILRFLCVYFLYSCDEQQQFDKHINVWLYAL